MKRILSIAITGLLLLGCNSDILDTTPYSSVASESMWLTDNLTDQGVTGVYSALRLGINTSSPSGYELYQIDKFGLTGQSRGSESLLMGTITSTDSYFSNFWQYFYEGIQRANDAILNIPLKSPSEEAKKARYVAECKFLRAYFYFRLNQVWKGVPIYLEPFTSEEATRARSTEQEVWQVIINDLTDSIEESNLPDKYAAGDGNYGHVTKGAAYALRGKVYMYQKEYALAAADFAKVQEAGYTLFADYKTLFKQANEQCDEMIFSLQHVGVSGYGSTTHFFCGSRSSYGSCWNNMLVSPNLVDLYENIDGSKFSWEAVLPGYDALTPDEREVFFLRDNLTEAEKTAAATRGAKMSLYLDGGNQERILAAYANRDPRLALNVITPYATYNGAYSGANATLTMRWPYRAEAAIDGDLRTDTQSYFYYLYRKFVYEGISEIVDRTYGPTDFPIVRYADVVLMWAEALNELGQTNEAVALVNQVRARAGVALLNSSAETTVTDQSDLLERIRNERRVEFPNEGITYFDELRWGTWKDKVFFAGNGAKQIWGENVFTYSYQGDYITTWPIPQTEIERNSNLTQNEGWSN